MILSTGMSDYTTVEAALGVLAFGYSHCDMAPSRVAFRSAWADPKARASLQDKVVLLHCTTDYPARAQNANLKAIDSMAAQFALPVGLSDHTLGSAVSVAAVARGACMIEKHLTLSRALPGPDHAASLEPAESPSSSWR